MKKFILHIVLASAFLTGAPTVLAADGILSAPTAIGVLTCTIHTSERRNYVMRSTAQVACVFLSQKGRTENYVGVSGVSLNADFPLGDNDRLSFTVYSAAHKDSAEQPFFLAEKFSSTPGPDANGSSDVTLIGSIDGDITLKLTKIQSARVANADTNISYLYLEPVKDQ